MYWLATSDTWSLYLDATLLHVVAMTRALGLLKSVKGEQPEVFEWKDNSESVVTCTFVGGKLAHHVLVRPQATEQS